MSNSVVIVEGPKENKAASLFIGRYQPLHEGHIKLMKTVLDEGKKIVIALRHTPIQETDPHSIGERIDMIKKELTELQARLMYKMQIYRWSNRNRNIMNEMDLIRKKIPF